MGKFIDVTGMQFGKLTAIKRVGTTKRSRAMWLCECECGSEKVAPLSDLRSGKIKTCGNSECKLPQYTNLENNKFGTLMVVCSAGTDKDRQKLWKCRCDCGRELIVSGHKLLSGHTTTCGHYPCRKTRLVDLTDKRYGKLVVVEKIINEIDNRTIWKCLCDCGNIIQVAAGSLTSGNTKSCGCLKIELFKERVTKHGLSHTPEYARTQSLKRLELKRLHDTEWDASLTAGLLKFQPACIICGSTEKLEIDHVLPLSKGYGLKPGNAVVLCKHHNDSKHDKDLNDLPEDWQFKIIHSAYHFKYFWEDQKG